MIKKSNVKYDKAIKLNNKRFIHNYEELSEEIEDMEDKEFHKYVKDGMDLFSEWIKENYDDFILLKRLKGVKNRKKYARIIKKRIREIEKKGNNKLINLLYGSLIAFLILVVGLELLYINNIENIYNEDIDFLNNMLSQSDKDSMTKERKINLLEKRIKKLQDKLESNSDVSIQELKNPLIFPGNRINTEDVELRRDMVVIRIKDPTISMFRETGSMLPTLSHESNGIEIEVKEKEDINIGDIISYKKNNEIFVHRVIDIKEDKYGWYVITKGDNGLKADREKVRFEQIKRVVVGVLY